MIKKEIQEQNSGDLSTNIQAKNIYVNGISTGEARNIALDIYKANFLELSNQAAQTALEKIESFNDKFLKKLIESNPSLLNKMHSPSLQITLLEAQKECIRSNSDNIENLLVEVLVERAERDDRGIMQIAYEESIKVLPKLTDQQINILTLNHIINDAYFYAGSQENLRNYLSNWVVKFKTEINYFSPAIRHIEYSGCGRISENKTKGFQHKYSQTYPGVLTKGFTLDEFKKDFGDDTIFLKLIRKCDNVPEKFQLNAYSTTELNKLLEAVEYTVEKDERQKIHGYLKKNLMNHEEQKNFFTDIEPEISFIFDFKNNDIFHLELTPVGLAIAMANFQKTIGYKLSPPYWMREA